MLPSPIASNHFRHMAAQMPQSSRNAGQDATNSLDLLVPQRTAPALVMSLILHVILLTTLGIIWSTEPAGSGEQPDRPIGIAIVHQLPDRDRYVDAKDLKAQEAKRSENAEQSETSSTASAAPPADLSPPIDLAGILDAMQSTPSPISGTGLAGETELGADAFGNGGGSKSNADGDESTTMVFGISGSGSRFVYVFDRSDSMNGHGGRPLRVAKAELIRSLKTLTEKQRFQIIFYNDKAKPFQPSGTSLQLIQGESSSVAMAERYVGSITAFGGTEHDIALKLALRMSPDVIFFLTDARIPRLSGSELADIRRRAQQSGTTIHAIEFGPEPGSPDDSFLRELAAQNNGHYKYIDVSQLSDADQSQANRAGDPK